FTAFVLLIPLAATSTAGMIRRLGKRWQTLHRLIYVSAIAGVIHYWWLVKADVRKPEYYAVVLILLLGYRLLTAQRKKAASPARVSAPARTQTAAGD
ncbi:MAG: sulfoxide reductase heme-binding subunit YedZ, partial [Terriglobales bacterium]